MIFSYWKWHNFFCLKHFYAMSSLFYTRNKKACSPCIVELYECFRIFKNTWEVPPALLSCPYKFSLARITKQCHWWFFIPFIIKRVPLQLIFFKATLQCVIFKSLEPDIAIHLTLSQVSSSAALSHSTGLIQFPSSKTRKSHQ